MRGSRRWGRRRRSVWVWNSFYQRRDGGGWTAWLEPISDVEAVDAASAVDVELASEATDLTGAAPPSVATEVVHTADVVGAAEVAHTADVAGAVDVAPSADVAGAAPAFVAAEVARPASAPSSFADWFPRFDRVMTVGVDGVTAVDRAVLPARGPDIVNGSVVNGSVVNGSVDADVETSVHAVAGASAGSDADVNSHANADEPPAPRPSDVDAVFAIDDADASPLVFVAFGQTPHAARKDLVKQINRRLKELPTPEAEAFRRRHAKEFDVDDMPVVEWPPPVAFHSVMQTQSKVVKDHRLAAAVAASDDVAVALQHVSKNYGAVEAVRGVSLTIPRGQVVVMLGPNGAGKTTTIHMMLGLRRPTKGMATLFGQVPTSLAARSRVGVMLQESGLPGLLRVGEIVDLFRSYYAAPLERDEVLDLAGIAHKRKALVTRLSGGERQRLYLALAVCGDPDALFLDEPTAGLDVEARQAFLASIRGFAALGKTVVMTTHYLEEAEAVADRIVVVNRGRIVADGTPSAIKAGFGKKRVSFVADIPVPELAFCDLPVAGLELTGRSVRFLADEPESVLRALFDRGVHVQDLEVSAAGLQEAFLALVESGGTKGQAVA